MNRHVNKTSQQSKLMSHVQGSKYRMSSRAVTLFSSPIQHTKRGVVGKSPSHMPHAGDGRQKMHMYSPACRPDSENNGCFSEITDKAVVYHVHMLISVKPLAGHPGIKSQKWESTEYILIQLQIIAMYMVGHLHRHQNFCCR